MSRAGSGTGGTVLATIQVSDGSPRRSHTARQRYPGLAPRGGPGAASGSSCGALKVVLEAAGRLGVEQTFQDIAERPRAAGHPPQPLEGIEGQDLAGMQDHDAV